MFVFSSVKIVASNDRLPQFGRPSTGEKEEQEPAEGHFFHRTNGELSEEN